MGRRLWNQFSKASFTILNDADPAYKASRRRSGKPHPGLKSDAKARCCGHLSAIVLRFSRMMVLTCVSPYRAGETHHTAALLLLLSEPPNRPGVSDLGGLQATASGWLAYGIPREPNKIQEGVVK